MSARPKILAICGSTRERSANLDLIRAIAELTADRLEVRLFARIDELPHFNPDLDVEPAPEKVAAFRRELKAADGILICTPEYAMGVPGTLKNAIDWTVSSCEFSHKPVALITASSMGEKGHASLLDTLKIIEAGVTDATQLVIPFVKTKVRNEKITDETTLTEVRQVLWALSELIGAAS